MKNILVAVDFDEHVDELIHYTKAFAQKLNAKVWILHIAAPDPDFIGNEVGPQYIRDSFAEHLRDEHRQLQKLAEDFQSVGLESDGLLIQGPTVETLLKEAEKLKVELIITGTEEHNFLYRALAGSVSMAIFKKSKIPVLSVPLGKA